MKASANENEELVFDSLEIIVRKGKNAGYLSKTNMMLLATIDLSSANAFNLNKPKMSLFGKELK